MAGCARPACSEESASTQSAAPVSAAARPSAPGPHRLRRLRRCEPCAPGRPPLRPTPSPGPHPTRRQSHQRQSLTACRRCASHRSFPARGRAARAAAFVCPRGAAGPARHLPGAPRTTAARGIRPCGAACGPLRRWLPPSPPVGGLAEAREWPADARPMRLWVCGAARPLIRDLRCCEWPAARGRENRAGQALPLRGRAVQHPAPAGSADAPRHPAGIAEPSPARRGLPPREARTGRRLHLAGESQVFQPGGAPPATGGEPPGPPARFASTHLHGGSSSLRDYPALIRCRRRAAAGERPRTPRFGF